MAEEMSISASSYAVFRTCPRLYYWKHVLYMDRVREEGARRFGTMYHAGLEAWWRLAGDRTPWSDEDEPLVAALKSIAENARHVQTDPFEVTKAEAMMVGYHATYFNMRFESPFSNHDGVEAWYNVPLLDPEGNEVPGWRVRGRRDATKLFEDGKIKIVEHKHTASEIHAGADYWIRLALDTQCSMYIDSARIEGVDTREALYDVTRKPSIKPQLATPEDKRKYTKGKGCTNCGGRAGGKEGTARGTGRIIVEVIANGKKLEKEADCNVCEGTGWKPGEAPRLHADQRVEDEVLADYRERVGSEIASDPSMYFRQMTLTRDDNAIAEARADLVVTTGEIGALVSLARQRIPAGGTLASTESRRCFPRNTQACTSMYGRRCDYIDVCAGTCDPWNSPLFQVRARRSRS